MSLDERKWWAFALPESIAYVPATSEAAARSALVATCYDKAPVHTWPLVSTRVCSRDALTRSLLRSRSATEASSPAGPETGSR